MTMQRRGNVEEEMLLPRTLEIKFGEEYSSVYYITIRVLFRIRICFGPKSAEF